MEAYLANEHMISAIISPLKLITECDNGFLLLSWSSKALAKMTMTLKLQEPGRKSVHLTIAATFNAIITGSQMQFHPFI